MDFGLTGKVGLVAGGSRGSGFAIARELVREGASVCLSGREPELVEEAVATLRNEGGRVEGVVAPMNTPEGVARMIAATRDAFGAPDLLIINPSRAPRGRALETISDEDLREALDIWVTSLLWFGREALPAMAERRWGRVVLLGSIAMKQLHLEDPMYAQNIRVAAAAFLKTMAQEYGQYGITANCIALGPIDTAARRSYLTEAGAHQAGAAATALGREGTAEEVAALAAFLCSDRAGYITGETIRIDGNMTHSLF